MGLTVPGHRSAAPPADSLHIALPVLQAARRARRPQGQMASWRATALVVVHVLILAHVVHWLINGRTMAPVVLSNAMHTLELGQVNPAAVLFAIVLGSTLLFGRFFCGWACHMAALQDLCAWALGRLGMRPAPFRSRLLPWIPVGLAGWMFLWPTADRLLVKPLLARWWPESTVAAPTAPFPGWRGAWSTDDLWAGLPGVAVAIPFLLVCGFATVWFLGARGFCNYGCPYGGLLRPIERLSPLRLTVDSARCDGCGRCTAACGSNVPVLDELRRYGQVVSAHCVRTLDCVEACPNDALTLRFTTPAVRHRRGIGFDRHRADPPLVAELGLLALFALVFWSTRGLYGVIPMLFAVGLGVCALPAAWTTWRMVRADDVRRFGFQLRRRGRMTPSGRVFLGLVALGGLVIVQSASVRMHAWSADRHDSRVTVSRETVFTAPETVPPEAKHHAARALHHYRRASAATDGGLGLARTPAHDLRAAWLHLVLGEPRRAETMFRRALDRLGPRDAVCADIGLAILLAGDPDGAEAYLAAVREAHPAFVRTLGALCEVLRRRGRADAAEQLLVAHLQRRPDDAEVRSALAWHRAMYGGR